MAETKLNNNQLAPFKHRICQVGRETVEGVRLSASASPWSSLRPFVFEFSFKTGPAQNFKVANCYLISANWTYGESYAGIIFLLGNGDNNYANSGKLDFSYQLFDTGNNKLNPSDWVGDVIEPGVWYRTRLTFNLSKYTVEYKKEADTSWTQVYEVESSNKLNNSYGMAIGTKFGNSGNYPMWKGTLVDIGSFYATSGDTVLFNGDELFSKNTDIYNSSIPIIEWYEP